MKDENNDDYFEKQNPSILRSIGGLLTFSTILPLKVQIFFEKYERIIMLVVFFLIWKGSLDGIIDFFGSKLLSAIIWLVELIPFTFL